MLSYDGVPQVLKDLPQWIVWRHERRNGKPTKVPYDAKKPGGYAKSNDSSTWTSFDNALDVASDVLRDYDGVGFMLQGTDLVGIDFDGVIHDGVAEPFVLDILEKLGSPYCEITPSGNGLRAFIHCAKLPAGQRKFSGNHYGAEIYSGGEGGRYLTVTGNQFSGQGVPEIADITVAYFMVTQIRNDKLKKLWMGDTSEYNGDTSRADLALLGLLGRLLNKDAQLMEKFFGASKLGQREKWTEREDYRVRTLKAALAGKQPVEEVEEPIYEPVEPEPGQPLEDFTTEVIWQTGDDVKLKRIEWLWQDRIPLGKITLFCGNPDNGKSLAATSVAAKVSKGENFPGDNGVNHCGPSEVVMLLGEDDIDDTAAPRMKAAGGDMSKVHFLTAIKEGASKEEREVRLDYDIAAIDKKLEENKNVRMIVIDPISNYLGDVSMVAEQEVRTILIPLKRLAEKHRLAVVIVMHLNKKTDMDAITRVGGAMAFIGVARCSWLFIRDEKDEESEDDKSGKDTFSMLRVKNNLAKASNSGLSYEVRVTPISIEGEDAYTPYIAWLGGIDKSADEALGNRAKRPIGHPTGPTEKMLAAIRFIEETLADGPKPSKWMFETAQNVQNIKKDTLQTASAQMVKDGTLAVRKVALKWQWELKQREEAAPVTRDEAEEMSIPFESDGVKF